MKKISQNDDKGQLLPRKHAPQRTCVACRQTGNKRDLIRLVRTSDRVEIDLRGKKTGRGVYLCNRRSCWESALKGNRIEYGLRLNMSNTDRQSLLEYGRSMPDQGKK